MSRNLRLELKYAFSIFAVFALFSLTAFGQLTTNRISGTVSGSDGLIPGAMVKIKSNSTAQEITTITDSKGNFSTNNLDIGLYQVTISANGFKTYTAQNVQLEVGKDFSLEVILEVGGVNEVVNVTVGQDLINSVDGKISNGVSRKQLDDLPSLGRNPLNFVPLQAGAASNPSQNTVINGVRTSATNTTIDGINVQDNFIRSNATDFSPARPTVDEVEEFAVSSQTGVDDGFGGAQIQFVTRRGGNQFNFRLFEFNRNSELAANGFFNNTNNIRRPFRNRNQFGGNVAGPILKDRLFFFASFEQLIDRVPAAVQTNTVLTANARQGIFTYTANANDAANGITAGQVVTVNLLNPALATGITSINSTIQSRFLAGLPTGNSIQAGDQRNTTGFSVVQNNNAEQRNFATRIDYVLNPKNNITGTFRYVTQAVNRADIDNSFNVVPRVTQPSNNPFLSLGWSSAVTNNFSNELRVGFFFSDPTFLRSDANLTNFVTPALITNPEVTFQNQGRDTRTYNIQDNATFIIGSHSLRFGGQYQRVIIDTFNDANIIPTYTIGTNVNTPTISTAQFMNTALFPGGVPLAQRATANALLALYGGIVSGGSATFNVQEQLSGFVPGATQRRLFEYDAIGTFISDSWRIKQNLTVNFGIRYDYYAALRSPGGLFFEPIITDINNPAASLLNPNGATQFIGGNSRVPNTFYRPDKNNFAPNVSVVYSPNVGGFAKLLLGEKPIFRGGYRISYINDELVRAPDNALSGNQGLALTSNVFNPVTNTTALNARIDNLPAIPVPTFSPSRTFAVNNQSQGFNGTVFGINPNLESPLIQEYSFGYQRDLGFNTALEIRYVGTQSNNLLRGIDLNQIDIFNNGFLADFNRARANFVLTGNAACTTAQNAGCQALTVFPNLVAGGNLTNATNTGFLTNGQPADLAWNYVINGQTGTVNFLPNRNAGAVDLLDNLGVSNYNALQIDVRRRFAQGFSLNANYTFSKSLTDAVGTAQGRFEPFLDNNNRGLDYTRADFDQTHKFNVLASYELPFGKGKSFLNQSGWLNYLVGGYQLGGILQIGSGAPITITDARGTFNRSTAGRSGRQTALTSLSQSELENLFGVFRTATGVFAFSPEVLGRNPDGSLNATIGGTGRGANGFGTPNFTGQVFFNNAPGQTSGLRRAIFNGPTTYNLDLSLIKRFAFGERLNVQLQADVFNALNQVNFIPGQFLDISGTNFGRITTTTQARVTQLAFRLNF
jgi:hypothetical protein